MRERLDWDNGYLTSGSGFGTSGYEEIGEIDEIEKMGEIEELHGVTRRRHGVARRVFKIGEIDEIELSFRAPKSASVALKLL